MASVILIGAVIVIAMGVMADTVLTTAGAAVLSARDRHRARSRLLSDGVGSAESQPAVSALGALMRSVPGITRVTALVDRVRADRRLARMASQLPHALSLVASGLEAGMSLTQAFALAPDGVPEPLGSELRRVSDETEGGSGLIDALRRLGARTPIAGLDTLLVAIELQYRLGGDTVALLNRAVEVLRQTDELRARLRVQTAQARLSARIVGALPLVLFIVLSLSSSEYLKGFFTSPIAFGSLVIALLMEAAGAVLVVRAAAVKV